MICPKCNTVWPDELKNVLKFCGACGAPMPGTEQSQPASSFSGTFPAIPNSSSQPGGELRFVTVLFADLAGYTAFAEDRAPDEVARIVGDLLQRLGRVVEDHGGAVDKFLGDAVVATFGLPRPDPNAARNAVRAGLAMQAAAEDFNRENGFSFGLRVGIHAGEVMFRAIGGSWTVMGDTVNTASRIQSATTPGKVWISRPVFEEVRRFFVLLSRPAVDLKGKKTAVQPYEVIEERRTPFVNLPPFVGREQEWDLLMQELRDTVAGRNLRVVILRGAAGIGKSRLAWELRDWLQRAAEIYRVSVVQFDAGQRLPSHGLNTLLRNRFDLPVEMDAASVLANLRQRVAEVIPTAGEHLELTVEAFAFVLGVSTDQFRTASMTGKDRWENAFFEIKSWLEQAFQDEPGVLFMEDAQKGDADTAAFIDWALRIPWHSPALLLVTVREEDFGPECYWYPAIARWTSQGLAREIRLKEISPDVLATALEKMLDGEVSPELAQRIAEHTEGNPLFAIELAMLLKETGQLAAGFTPGNLLLPGSVREVMEARIERLGQDGKEVAKRGSLIGRRFSREAVERTWDRPTTELNSGYAVLHETETVYEEESKLFAGKIEDVFRHGRLQEAVLARIPREERLRWLRELETWALAKLKEEINWTAAAALLIPLIIRSREEQHDTWQVSLWQEVLGLLHSQSYRSREAARVFQAALEKASGVRRLVLGVQAAEAYMFDGESEEALAVLKTAQTAPDTVSGGEISPIVAQLLDALTTDALAHWQTLTPFEASAALRLAQGKVLTNQARVEEARQVLAQLGRDLSNVSSEAGRRLLVRWGRAWAYLLSELIGRQNEAEAVCNYVSQYPGVRAADIADEWNIFLSIEEIVAQRLGHYTRAREITDQRLQAATASNDLRTQARIWNDRGIIAHLVGNLDQAAEGYARARDISHMIGDRRGEVIGVYNLAGIYVDQLKLDQAAQQIDQYRALSRMTGNHLADAYAPLSTGNIEAERGNYAGAQVVYLQAIQVAEQNGWQALIDTTRVSQASADFYLWLDQSDTGALARAARLLETCVATNLDEYEAEQLAVMILVFFYSGSAADVQTVLARLRQRQDEAGVSDRCWLQLVEDVIARRPLADVQAQFEKMGFLRAARLVEKLQR